MVFTRPANKKDFQRREVSGIIRAFRFVARYSKSDTPIDMSAILQIHNEMWKECWPEIAGKYRTEDDIEIYRSGHQLPHHTEIARLLKEANIELTKKIEELGSNCRGVINNLVEIDDEWLQCVDRVVSLAAWLHHKITYIHPFLEGNGRTARLAANLILERYGLVGLSVKIEKESKEHYFQTLAQIDTVGDYQPLKDLIYEGLAERYNGVPVRYYSLPENQQ